MHRFKHSKVPSFLSCFRIVCPLHAYEHLAIDRGSPLSCTRRSRSNAVSSSCRSLTYFFPCLDSPRSSFWSSSTSATSSSNRSLSYFFLNVCSNWVISCVFQVLLVEFVIPSFSTSRDVFRLFLNLIWLVE